MALTVLSLNGENMNDFFPRSGALRGERKQRAQALAELIRSTDADIIGLVEAPAKAESTEAFVAEHLGGTYEVHQGDLRGVLGLAVLVRTTLGLQVENLTKAQCGAAYPMPDFDADNDGIKEVYSWANRVPHEVVLSGGGLAGPTRIVLVHAKSKGVFIPGDLYRFELVSRASRMKQRAQANSIRRRLDGLLTDDPDARIVVMGDMNDGPEYDIYAAELGGAFLEPVMGSVWEPDLILTNTHAELKRDDRWTISYADRVVNPVGASRYGQPTEMRSWIDHILVSPALRSSIVAGTARIHRTQPPVAGVPASVRGTDHHPPSIALEL